MKNARIKIGLPLWIIFTLSFALVPARSNAQTAPPETVDQLLEKASHLLGENKPKETRKEIEKALKLDKNSSEAYLFLGLAYKNENKRKDAIKKVQQAIKLRPNYANAHYLLAVLFYESDEAKKSQAELDTAFAQGANFANAYILQGQLELDEQHYEEALKAYEKAAQAKPDSKAIADLDEKIDTLKSLLRSKQVANDLSIIKPKALNRPMPHYTEAARRNKVTGIVRLRVFIDEQGKVKH